MSLEVVYDVGRLKSLRLAAGYSQRAVSKRIRDFYDTGVSPSHISKYERGLRTPTGGHLYMICQTFTAILHRPVLMEGFYHAEEA